MSPKAADEKKRNVLGIIAETSVIIAAAGSLFWSGKTANAIETIKDDVAEVKQELGVLHDNVLHLCDVVPQSKCER